MLKAKPRAALLRRGLVAAFAFAACGILHRVALIENDDTIKIGSHPFHDLFDPRYLLVARVGSQRGVGGKKDALLQTGRRALAEARQRPDQQPVPFEAPPGARGALEPLVGLASPKRAAG